MEAEAEALAQLQDLRQGVDGSGRGRADRRDDGSHAARLEPPRERAGVHASAGIARDGLEGHAEHGADAGVGVVGLRGGDDGRAGTQLPRDPEGLQVGHRAAAAEVTEVVLPAEHAGDLGDRLLLHLRALTPAVERVVVRVQPHRERVGQPRHGVRRLQHLARVERMEVRVVVLEARRGLLEHARDFRSPRDPRARGRQPLEALRESLDGRAENASRLGGGEVGARRAHRGSKAEGGSKARRTSGRRSRKAVPPKKAAPRSPMKAPAATPAARIVAASAGDPSASRAVEA